MKDVPDILLISWHDILKAQVFKADGKKKRNSAKSATLQIKKTELFLGALDMRQV